MRKHTVNESIVPHYKDIFTGAQLQYQRLSISSHRCRECLAIRIVCQVLHACLCLQDGPEDDDSWMTEGAADLEAELAQRQKELEGNVAKHAKRTAQGLDPTESAPEFDPSEMVSKLNVSSGHMHSSLLQCYAGAAISHSA